MVEAETLVIRLRMKKSPAEIAAIRQCVEVCDSAQLAITAYARPGMSQAEILNLARVTIDAASGATAPAVLEATYASAKEGWGEMRDLREGDLLLTDIAPHVGGYWGDSCDTRFIGKPSIEGRRLMRTVEEALLRGTEAARPGITASSLDEIMRAHVGLSYPRYPGAGGHGIGLEYHELPRLIPGEEIVLEAGMVLAMEPGVYLESAMVRLEHLVLIVPAGCEVLSQHLGWHEHS